MRLPLSWCRHGLACMPNPCTSMHESTSEHNQTRQEHNNNRGNPTQQGKHTCCWDNPAAGKAQGKAEDSKTQKETCLDCHTYDPAWYAHDCTLHAACMSQDIMTKTERHCIYSAVAPQARIRSGLPGAVASPPPLPAAHPLLSTACARLQYSLRRPAASGGQRGRQAPWLEEGSKQPTDRAHTSPKTTIQKSAEAEPALLPLRTGPRGRSAAPGACHRRESYPSILQQHNARSAGGWTPLHGRPHECEPCLHARVNE